MHHDHKTRRAISVTRGTTVAVIGPDGAGKSTLVTRLHQRAPFHTEIVYMGGNAASANVTLPTTRWLTNRWLAQTGQGEGGGIPAKPATAAMPGEKRHASPVTKLLSGLKSIVKLVHELLEFSYRFLVAYKARRRGAVVLYDRYIYDSLIDAMADNPSRMSWFRANLFKRIFPRPDLLIVLEAPGIVLFARKGEHSPERLDRVRDACREIASNFRHVEYIDATRPSDEVVDRAMSFITMHAGTPVSVGRRLSRVG
jgi:thymidylate kinase